MNNVNTNALPSRLFIGAGLAVVFAGVLAYAIHISGPAPKSQVVAAPALPPPPPVAQTPPPPPAEATPSPEAPATAAPAPAAPAVAQQNSSSSKSDESATPSEPKVASSRHTVKARSTTRNSDDTFAAAAPKAPKTPAPATDATATSTVATTAAANSTGDAATPAAATSATASNAQEGAAPIDAAGMDSKITTEVKSRLAADTVTKDANISVTTTQGVVVLSGTLTSQDAVDHVKQVAQNVQDVKSVDTSALKVTGTS